MEQNVRKEKILNTLQSNLKYFRDIKNRHIQTAVDYIRKNQITKAVNILFAGWDHFYNTKLSEVFFDLINLVFRISAYKFGRQKNGTMKYWEPVDKAQKWSGKAKHQFPKYYRLLSAFASIDSNETEYYRDKCLALNPPIYGLYVILFLTWVNYKDEKAEDVFLRMIKLFPNQKDNSYLLYIMSIADRGKISALIKKYRKIIFEERPNKNAYQNLALAYTWIHDFEKARRCFAIYLNYQKEFNDPLFKSIYTYTGGMLSFLNGQYEEARKQFIETAEVIRTSTYIPPGQISHLSTLLENTIKWFDFDKTFRDIFLKDNLLEVRSLVRRLHGVVRKNYDESLSRFSPLISSKIYSVEALNDSFLFKDSALKMLDKAKDCLQGHQYLEIEEKISHVENFILSLISYGDLKKISAEKEKGLLEILRKAQSLPVDTTYASLLNRLDDLKEVSRLSTDRIIKEVRDRKQLEILEKVKLKKLGIEKAEYVVFLSQAGGIGSFIDKDTNTENQVHKNYSTKKEKFDIFIYEQNVYKKVLDEGKARMISLNPSMSFRGLLILFLKYKDMVLPYVELYHKAFSWKAVSGETNVYHDKNAKLPEDVMNTLKNAVNELKREFDYVKGFDIPRAKNSTYKCEGNFKFCLILKKSTNERYTMLFDKFKTQSIPEEA